MRVVISNPPNIAARIKPVLGEGARIGRQPGSSGAGPAAGGSSTKKIRTGVSGKAGPI